MDYSNFTSSTSLIVQIVAGIIVTYIIYVLSLFAINADKLAGKEKIDNTEKRAVPIIKGTMTSSEVANGSRSNVWTSSIPFMGNYLPLLHSVNKQGGAQFSYSFWIYVGNPTAARGKTLFIKGDNKKYKYEKQVKSYNYLDEGGSDFGSPEIIVDRTVFCPMVAFGPENLELDVYFNTFHNMHEKASLKRINSSNSLKRNNLQGLFPNSWFSVTVTFEDNLMVNDFEKGVMVRIYINGALYQIHKYNTTLKQNRGDFYLFPDEESIPDCKIADLTYYNYALRDEEVKNIASQKPNLHINASTTGENSSKKDFETGIKNHMDIYNI